MSLPHEPNPSPLSTTPDINSETRRRPSICQECDQLPAPTAAPKGVVTISTDRCGHEIRLRPQVLHEMETFDLPFPYFCIQCLELKALDWMSQLEQAREREAADPQDKEAHRKRKRYRKMVNEARKIRANLEIEAEKAEEEERQERERRRREEMGQEDAVGLGEVSRGETAASSTLLEGAAASLSADDTVRPGAGEAAGSDVAAQKVGKKNVTFAPTTVYEPGRSPEAFDRESREYEPGKWTKDLLDTSGFRVAHRTFYADPVSTEESRRESDCPKDSLTAGLALLVIRR